MPKTPLEVVAVIGYVLLLAATVTSIIFWRRKLDRWIPKMLKASPQLVMQFCLFCRGVVLRFSNLLIGGAIGLAWVFYNQFTSQPLPMNVFWSLVVVMFVCACFGAWREQFLAVEGHKTRRPDFRYSPGESRIVPRTISPPGVAAQTRADFTICFRNSGTGTAYNPRLTVYFGWLDDPSRIFRVGGTQAIGDWARGEPIAQNFWISQGWIVEHRELGIKVEIESRANSEHGETTLKTFWFQWIASFPSGFLAASAALIETMSPHIEALKNSLSTPLPPVSDTEAPPPPPA